MIFKTFQSDLDGISNKIGFSKRSFTEWSKQVSTSFNESEGTVNKFKTALKTAFTVPVEKDNDWIKNNLGEIVNKENIDSFIPELTIEDSKKLTEQIREQSIAVANGSKSWDNYFSALKENNQGYIVDLIKNTDDLSKLTGEDLVKANQAARESAIAHNQALQQQTLGSKAATIATAFDNYIHRVDKANEATEEAISTYESITSKIDSLESKLSEIDGQIRELDPITDAEDIKNLQAETEELNTQLEILREKQRIAGIEADKAAQESLGMTQASRYKTITAYDGFSGAAMEETAYVTKDEELLNAIAAYDGYREKINAANQALKEMAETGSYTQKEWNSQEKNIEKYSQKMEDARTHANELAITLNEQVNALTGDTEASKSLKDSVEGSLAVYDSFLSRINEVTDALNKQADTSPQISSQAAPPLSIAESIQKMGELKDILGKVEASMADFSENGKQSIDVLNDLVSNDAISGLASFEDFIHTISDSASTTEQVSSAYNTLVDELIRANGYLEGLDYTNQSVTASFLEEMGIINAEEVVMAELGFSVSSYSMAKREAALAGIDLKLLQLKNRTA